MGLSLYMGLYLSLGNGLATLNPIKPYQTWVVLPCGQSCGVFQHLFRVKDYEHAYFDLSLLY